MSVVSQCVLLLTDDTDVRNAAQQSLAHANLDLQVLSDMTSALDQLHSGWTGVIIADHGIADFNISDFLTAIEKIDPELPVILMDGKSDLGETTRPDPTQHDAAFDVIRPVCAPTQFNKIIQRAVRHRRLVLENRMLRGELAHYTNTAPAIIGTSPAMEKLRISMNKAAASHAHVLIHGESGSGKEVIARNLHVMSRRPGPFVVVDCGGMPEHLIDAELFGDRPFETAGTNPHPIGKLDLADTGTLFLDEIESLPLALQVKLLRVLQERSRGRARPDPGQPHQADLRIIAATKIDLRKAATQGAFREDLYYRLNVIELSIPPLRERPDDIPLLFDHFTRDAAKRLGRTVDALSLTEITQIKAHDWPGNIRALRNAAERRVLGEDRLIAPMMAATDQGEPSSLSLPQQVEAFEKKLIIEALGKHGGNVTSTVTALGMPRKTFYDKLTKYGIIPAEFRRQRKA